MPSDDIPMLTIHMDRKCAGCGEKGATDGGLCLECITKRMGRTMKREKEGVQQLLDPPTGEELQKLREKLSGLVGEYIGLEDQKKAADADYNERMGEIWDEVRGLREFIKEAEEAN